MLVLSRKKDQRIVVGSNIEVVVLAVEGKQVRLGLIAPREVPIRRKELKVWQDWALPDKHGRSVGRNVRRTKVLK